MTQISPLQSSPHCGACLHCCFSAAAHTSAPALINSCSEINLGEVPGWLIYGLGVIKTSLGDQRLFFFLICSTSANSPSHPPSPLDFPSSSQFFPVLLFFLIIRPPHSNPFHTICVRWKWVLSLSLEMGRTDQWMGGGGQRAEVPLSGDYIAGWWL